MEIKLLGNLFGDDKVTGFAGNVWDKDYLSPTLNTMQGGCKQPMIIDSTIVAMRGRNPTNPSDRKPGIELEQTLEVNQNGTSNCLTSVQKDNLVLENVIIGGEQKHQSVKKDGVCTCLTSSMGTGGGYVPMIPETVRIKQATSQGYIECEVGGVADFSYPDSKTRRGRVQDNGKTCPTLTAESKDICKIEKVGQISNDGSQYGTVIADNGLSPNLVAGTHGYANSCIATQYRIRKLTPRECWRLMDFSDEDFKKAAEVNSNTQLYKQAGNSIVVNVLVAILGQLLPGKENVYKELSE